MATEIVEFTLDFRSKRYTDAQLGLRAIASDLEKSDSIIYPTVKKELQKFLTDVTDALARRHGNPYPGGTSANSLSKRSGDLVQSLKENTAVKGSNLENLVGEIGGIFYARIHEYGGTITAKRAKYLTIPLPAALNSNGTPKKKSARDWDKTFIITSKKGNLLIVQRDGRKLIPLYVLKTSVYIPPRLNLRKTVDTALPVWVDELSDKLLAAIISGTGQ